MNSTATQITKLINTPNPSAPVTTHALSELGNGRMQDGLKRIVRYYASESASNLKLGRIQGATVGILITVTVGGGIALINHAKQKKKIKREGQVILNTLQHPSSHCVTQDDSVDDITEEQSAIL